MKGRTEAYIATCEENTQRRSQNDKPGGSDGAVHFYSMTVSILIELGDGNDLSCSDFVERGKDLE
jgi:hypothetical protein